ncbi:MAG: GNAT family N-acetyltransferase [Tepidisphaeraceae bacterium]
MITLERVTADQILDLRHAVLLAGLSRETAHFAGDDNEQTVHLAAIENGKIIGCATVLTNAFGGQPACQLRGMAVHPADQRRGVGRELLEEVDRIAAEKGAKLLWANCRKPAVPFYAKHGWSVVSDEFDVPTAGPHFKMIRKL